MKLLVYKVNAKPFPQRLHPYCRVWRSFEDTVLVEIDGLTIRVAKDMYGD